MTGQTGFVYLKDGIYEPKQSNDLYIYSSEKLLTGSVASFSPNFYENDKNYISKSLDNRISVAGLLEILLKLEALINCNFYCVFTVQEEIGLRGAKVAVSTIKPDFIFNLDTSAIGERNNLEIGLGVGLKISDSIGVSDEKLVNVLTKICQNFNIQYQLEVSDCGTTEMIMVNENDYGSRVVGISLPCQYPHSAFSIVDKKDYIQYKKLLSKIIYNINNVIC